MLKIVLSLCCLTVILAVPTGVSFSGSALDEGIRLYRANKLEQALKNLERGLADEPENPEILVYLAETLRRLGRKGEAVEYCRRVLETDDCHSFAHTTLADACNPMFGIWEGASEDSTWLHLLKAIECDSTDGNAWTGIWVEAMRRGETDIEKRAARAFIDSKFLASPLLAYNRWVLSNLPERALLLTNGDMDTYPAVALQAVEGLRPDVCVVNLSLLNLPWYAQLVTKRCGLLLPFEGSELEDLTVYRDENGSIMTRSRQIVSGWAEMVKRGELERPLALAATVSDVNFTQDFRRRLKLAGPFYLCHAESVGNSMDMTTLRIALGSVNQTEFRGSWVSQFDRSPVRRVGTDRVSTNITALAIRYAYSLLESGRASEAQVWAQWAEDFDRGVAMGPYMANEIGELRNAISIDER